MYSQNQEENYITEYFSGRTGKFIDIGAYDVFRLSNTRKLFELGWRGILVEPDPTNYKSISDFYKDEPRIEVLNFAVGNSNEDLEFLSSGGDAVSTSVVEHAEKWKGAGVKFEKVIVKQMHVAELLELHKDAIFLSIDTESTNMLVFNSIPDNVFEQIEMLCIEHDNCIVEIVSKLEPFGLKTKYLNAENIILAK